jgi:hypothetical protein
VVVGWDAPASTGDAPVTSYRVYRGEGTSGERLVATVGDVRSFADPGVEPGHEYGYRVSAVNDIGEGIVSARATVDVPGGTLARTVVPVGPADPQRVVAIAGRNDGALYCVTAAIDAEPEARVACANRFGAAVPDVGPVDVTVPAGEAVSIAGRYFYDPAHVVTAATVLGDAVVVRAPVAPADAEWLEANGALVGVEVTVNGTTVTIPALGQVLGALNESSVGYYADELNA